MRLTDDRYSNERSQFELALRMIRHEARTRTIRECTGLSDDRIRKLYTTYFRNGGTPVRRRRGKSPRQVTRFVSSPSNQLQATTLVSLYCGGLLLRLDAGDRVRPRWAVISAARKNPFGNPSPEVLERLLRHGARLLLTMDHGAIFLETDGYHYIIRSYALGRIESGELLNR